MSPSPISTDVDVCIVGAGPHGLTAAAHLLTAQPSLRSRIAVLDPTGSWLSIWQQQFARLEIDVLRSPIVHHPGVGPAELAQFVSDRRLPRSHLPYDPPMRSVFESFCTELVGELGVADLPTSARVVGVDPGPAEGEPSVVRTDRGELRARHVVWTANTCRPNVPDALQSVDSGDRVRFGTQVDLRAIDSLHREHVVVVGGGLTAGHLVMGARERGATVTLVTRRPIVERDFDVEPGWLGPLCLDAYSRERDPAKRLRRARDARGGGSMPPWMCRRIETGVERGWLDHVVGEIDAARCTDDGVELDVGTDTLVADRCWLATGTTPDHRADPALDTAIEPDTCGVVDGVPALDVDLRVGDTSLFVTGRLATIELGPAAGNLWGARSAARRISQAITGIDLDTDASTFIAPSQPD